MTSARLSDERCPSLETWIATDAAATGQAQAGTVVVCGSTKGQWVLHGLCATDLLAGLAEDTLRTLVGRADRVGLAVVLDPARAVLPLLAAALGEVRTALAMGGTWLGPIALLDFEARRSWLADPDDLVLTGPGEPISTSYGR